MWVMKIVASGKRDSKTALGSSVVGDDHSRLSTPFANMRHKLFVVINSNII